MFTITFNDADLNKVMASVEGAVKEAAVFALNRAAVFVRADLRREMESVFDRPTPFTLNGLQTINATKDHLEAKVWFKYYSIKTAGHHYLEPQVFGGSRPFKGFEKLLCDVGVLPKGWFAVPGPDAVLDQYGNMSTGQIIQILSYFRAFHWAPHNAGNRPFGPYARQPKNPQIFFVVQPGDADWGRRQLPPGVYLRVGRSFKQVLSFVEEVYYAKLFKFFEVAQQSAAREVPKVFAEVLKARGLTGR
jgi:hypothetical protein